MDDTKKVTVSWSQVLDFKAEFEVPANLTSDEDILDWVMIWGKDGWDINTDWGSFKVESEPCRGISRPNYYDCTQEQGHDGPCTFPKEGEYSPYGEW